MTTRGFQWFLFLLILLVCQNDGIEANPILFNRTEFASHPANPPGRITVGAYYYPWWYRHFYITKEGYVRKFLQPGHPIRLGEYDDRMPSIVEQHLAWSRQANIDVWVSSWWGNTSSENAFLRDLIFTTEPKISNLNDHKVAILYETTGRIKKDENYDLKRVPDDFEYICNEMKYFDHPNYYKIDGRPVLVIYLTRMLNGQELLDDVVPIILSKCPDVYIIGDQVWGSPPGKTLDYLDAVTNYDWYGNVGRPKYAGQSRVNDYYAKSVAWKEYAKQHKTFFVPAVSPGFNDRGVRLEVNHTAMSRRLDVNMAEGTLFAAQLVNATKLVDAGADYLMLVNSFNEWHEDTQIEPCDGITTTLPYNYTQGVEYVGYGTMYLDILATYTTLNCKMDAVWKNTKKLNCAGIEKKLLKKKDITKDCLLSGTGGQTGMQACSQVCNVDCRTASATSTSATTIVL